MHNRCNVHCVALHCIVNHVILHCADVDLSINGLTGPGHYPSLTVLDALARTIRCSKTLVKLGLREANIGIWCVALS